MPLLAAAEPESADDDAVEHSVGADRFAAGRAVDLGGRVAGDVFAAGGRVTLDAAVAGEAFLAGGHVEVRGPVDKGLYVAGGTVIASGTVRRAARLVGGTVELTPAAHVAGSLSMAGQSLSFGGTADSDLQMAGRHVTLSGSVAGDAEIAAERIEIGPDARIGGTLRYRSDREPVIAAGAAIGGGLERLPGTLHDWSWRGGAHRALRGVGRGIWFSGSFLLGALLLLLAPGFLAATSRQSAAEWPLCLGVGLAVLCAVPAAAVLLLITLIGIPLGVLAIALYVVVLLLGHIVAAVAVADFALGRWLPARAGLVGWRMLGLFGALLAIGLVRHVPLVGDLAALLVFLAGVGALSLRALRPRTPPAAA